MPRARLLPEARITRGYRLSARSGAAGAANLLADCYRNSLALALAHGIRSIAFPAISTGVYGYPKRTGCAIAAAEARRFVAENDAIARLSCACFDAETAALYRAALAGD